MELLFSGKLLMNRSQSSSCMYHSINLTLKTVLLAQLINLCGKFSCKVVNMHFMLVVQDAKVLNSVKGALVAS